MKFRSQPASQNLDQNGHPFRAKADNDYVLKSASADPDGPANCKGSYKWRLQAKKKVLHMNRLTKLYDIA